MPQVAVYLKLFRWAGCRAREIVRESTRNFKFGVLGMVIWLKRYLVKFLTARISSCCEYIRGSSLFSVELELGQAEFAGGKIEHGD